ncbi:hypothetical protein [Kordiimonas sp.]|uniref:hypothetical protein n=1 Tax=Kordiimonas sp. TaxID=1970157 RepID=UPI003A905EFA
MAEQLFRPTPRPRNILLALAFCASYSFFPLLANDTPPDESRIKEAVIVSAENPALAIRMADDAMRTIGRHAITIGDRASGERFIFGETDGAEVKRLFIAQFEAFHADNDGTYNYDLSKSPEVAGYRWRSNAYAFDMTASRRDNPAGEAAGTAALLEKFELNVPENWLMWRSLTVTDESRKGELILFYVEFGKDHNMTLADIYVGDEETPEWISFQKDLERRANAVFELAPVVDGIPLGESWVHIPVGGE